MNEKCGKRSAEDGSPVPAKRSRVGVERSITVGMREVYSSDEFLGKITKYWR